MSTPATPVRTNASCTYRVPTRGNRAVAGSFRRSISCDRNDRPLRRGGVRIFADIRLILKHPQEVKSFSQKRNRQPPPTHRQPLERGLFKKSIGYGGHFVNTAHLIAKYGLVPQEAPSPEFYLDAPQPGRPCALDRDLHAGKRLRPLCGTLYRARLCGPDERLHASLFPHVRGR